MNISTQDHPIVEEAATLCKNQGIRLTDKRKRVLSMLVKSHYAQSAYDLIDQYRVAFDESISPISMYRILTFLETEHLVHKINLANKYVACAHIHGDCQHDHTCTQFLICTQCLKVEEIQGSPCITDELKKNTQRAGFQLANPQLEIACICNSCLAKNS